MAELAPGTARISVSGREEVELPLAKGADGTLAIDITKLFPDHGILALGPGLNSVAAVESQVTRIDPKGNGKEAILEYRGIPIAELAQMSEPLEVALLLLSGELPNRHELSDFADLVREETIAHAAIGALAHSLPRALHPMGMLGVLTNSLQALPAPAGQNAMEIFDREALRIFAQMPILAAWVHAARTGRPMPEPDSNRGYVENYLALVSDDPDAAVDPLRVQVMNAILILHADHEQNASTTTVRGIISTGANPYAAVTGGIGALWGPLHGGANERVIAMLQKIVDEGISPQTFVDRAVESKAKEDRLMGFGHRIYKAYDPRAAIMRGLCQKYFETHGASDPLLETALSLEGLALNNPYFIEHTLYPNVDFYSGILMRAMGIPADEFTVIFALGRVAGWLAHAREMKLDAKTALVRPRQLYKGEINRPYVPIEER